MYLKFTIPAANANGTKPADLARVDVFAFTALAPSDVVDVRDMTRVASITVRRPPEPEAGGRPSPAKPPKKPKPPKPPKPPEPGEDQGALVHRERGADARDADADRRRAQSEEAERAVGRRR